MLDLFRMEVEDQATILNDNLLVLEGNPNAVTELESLMRAAHSIKGAARIVKLDEVVKVAHVMEDCFVAAQQGAIALDSADQIDVLLQGVDLLRCIAQLPETEIENWLIAHQAEIENLEAAISAILAPTELKDEDEGVGSWELGIEVDVAEESSPLPSEANSSIPSLFSIETPPPQTNQPPSDRAVQSALTPSEPTHYSSSATRSLGTCDSSMLNLFYAEVETQAMLLTHNLLDLKNNSAPREELQSSIQAAHLIKGAAKIVQINGIVKIAQALEDCLIAALKVKTTLEVDQIDSLLQGVALLLSFVQVSETEADNWLAEQDAEIENLVNTISAINRSLEPQGAGEREIISPPLPTPSQVSALAKERPNSFVRDSPPQTLSSDSKNITNATTKLPPGAAPNTKSVDRVVRVSAENLNRLMGLAGESLVEANWLQPFADSLLKLRNRQMELYNLLEKLQESLVDLPLNQRAESYLSTTRQKAGECRDILADRLGELELFASRSANLSDRLYREVIASHMRPFADGVQAFPRMMRDLARILGKQVKFEILGKSTQVDRDILEKLEAPLTHILRNAIDHGIELPEERLAAGKPAEGRVRIEAAHRAGMLSITVSDDGRGVELDQLRQKIVSKGMIEAAMAAQLTEPELMEFLFLPGFSTASGVTEISGRGVGLDVVQSMMQEVGGIVRAVSQPRKGMSFHLQLPLTLSVIRTLLVEIAGEPYAFPLTRIDRIAMINRSDIAVVENRQYFILDEQNIGLVVAHQLLELNEFSVNSEVLSVIVISDRLSCYGLVVDRFLGERDLVVRPLDPRLGKVPNISAAALMEDGSPVLIMDIEDMVRSIDKLLTGQKLSKVSQGTTHTALKKHKRILVVDDSITVREVERKLLENNGYQVEVAVNGMDGWNAVRTNQFDLVITDVDMPRMNGIELVSQIKNNPVLKSIPVIIVSYKDREEDRLQGLEVGADYYLTKSSFHDDTLLNSVIDLIGNS